MSALDDLKREEGWRPEPYLDTENFWTVGYGFLIDVRKPWSLPQAVGDLWLQTLVAQTESALHAELPWLASQPDDVQNALVQMAYQLGVSGVLKFQKMLDALKASDRALAANEALDSQWARQTPQRAARVAALIRGKE